MATKTQRWRKQQRRRFHNRVQNQPRGGYERHRHTATFLTMTVAALHQRAQEAGLTVPKRATKAQLVERLVLAEVPSC